MIGSARSSGLFGLDRVLVATPASVVQCPRDPVEQALGGHRDHADEGFGRAAAETDGVPNGEGDAVLDELPAVDMAVDEALLGVARG